MGGQRAQTRGLGGEGYLKKGHKIKKIFVDILSQNLFLRGLEGVGGGGLFYTKNSNVDRSSMQI